MANDEKKLVKVEQKEYHPIIVNALDTVCELREGKNPTMGWNRRRKSVLRVENRKQNPLPESPLVTSIRMRDKLFNFKSVYNLGKSPEPREGKPWENLPPEDVPDTDHLRCAFRVGLVNSFYLDNPRARRLEPHAHFLNRSVVRKLEDIISPDEVIELYDVITSKLMFSPLPDVDRFSPELEDIPEEDEFALEFYNDE